MKTTKEFLEESPLIQVDGGVREKDNMDVYELFILIKKGNDLHQGFHNYIILIDQEDYETDEMFKIRRQQRIESLYNEALAYLVKMGVNFNKH